MSNRIHNARARLLLKSAAEAAALISPGDTVAMSGFTGAGLSEGRAAGAGRAHGSGARGGRSRSRSSC